MPEDSTPKRPIGLSDVLFGSTVFPIVVVVIFVAVDRLVDSPRIVPYPLNLLGFAFWLANITLALRCYAVVRRLPYQPGLVTWGPWAYVRHPIYSAALLLSFGLAVLVGTLLLFVGFLLHFLIDGYIGPVIEERRLKKRFPKEYERYASRVPRTFPRIRRFRS